MSPVPPVYMNATEATRFAFQKYKVKLGRGALTKAHINGTIRAAAYVGEMPVFNDEVLSEYLAFRQHLFEVRPNHHGNIHQGDSEWGRRLRAARDQKERQHA